LPRFAAEGISFQLIFIDGQHRFDNVLVDFFLADAVCSVNGIMIFDDIWMPSIQKVVSFITKNRGDYSYMPTDVGNAAVFRKIGRDERRWDHYADF